jgi:hypothetical protein
MKSLDIIFTIEGSLLEIVKFPNDNWDSMAIHDIKYLI